MKKTTIVIMALVFFTFGLNVGFFLTKVSLDQDRYRIQVQECHRAHNPELWKEYCYAR
jgi:hypothetical protein